MNVGLVIFMPEGTDVRLLPTLAKVRALNGRIDLDEIRALPGLIEE